VVVAEDSEAEVFVVGDLVVEDLEEGSVVAEDLEEDIVVVVVVVEHPLEELGHHA
jgi:hypothetical protein